jgi:hypothetical protein
MGAGVARQPKQASMAALERFARDEAPGTAAAARAEAWLGDLWRGEHDPGQAEAHYRRAAGSDDAEARGLGNRGLGDLAMADRHYRAAASHYREAAALLTGDVMTTELGLKRALAEKLGRRAAFEWACWLAIAALLAAYLIRSRFWQAPRLALPTEALYVVPPYALLLLGGAGRDPAVWKALALCAVWSTALIAAAGLAARRKPPVGAARVLHALVLAGANVALFYACLNRAAVLDSLFYTVAP